MPENDARDGRNAGGNCVIRVSVTENCGYEKTATGPKVRQNDGQSPYLRPKLRVLTKTRNSQGGGTYLEDGLVRDDDVGWFDVAVRDKVLVQVGEPEGHLVKHVHGQPLVEPGGEAMQLLAQLRGSIHQRRGFIGQV
eukprot:1175865-Prorocentrum_minimum.AAC.1